MVPTPRTRDDLAAALQPFVTEMAHGERVTLVAIHQDNGRAIGMTGLHNSCAYNERTEIAVTWYARPYWHTAITVESHLLILTHAFEDLGMGRVSWTNDHDNARSRLASLRTVGARYEGTHRRDQRRPDGTFRDSDHFSVLRPEWPAIKQRLVAKLGSSAGAGSLAGDGYAHTPGHSTG